MITKLKSNMKGAIMKVSDRVLLRKRASFFIETINDELKNMAQIEQGTSHFHTVVNLLDGIKAYCFFPKKPSINLEKVVDRQLTLF